MESTRHQFEAALARLGGDEELFRELVNYFIEDGEELMQVIRMGVAEGDADPIQRAAHSLRGLAANFDAEQVMALARSIEQMAAQGDLQPAPAAFVHLEVEVQSLRNVLKRYTSQPSPQMAPNTNQR